MAAKCGDTEDQVHSMVDTVIAVFEHGVFLPESPCDLPEGSRVVLSVRDAARISPPEAEAEDERRRIVEEVVQRMMRNPLPPDTLRFSRSDMYDRD